MERLREESRDDRVSLIFFFWLLSWRQIPFISAIGVTKKKNQRLGKGIRQSLKREVLGATAGAEPWISGLESENLTNTPQWTIGASEKLRVLWSPSSSSLRSQLSSFPGFSFKEDYRKYKNWTSLSNRRHLSLLAFIVQPYFFLHFLIWIEIFPSPCGSQKSKTVTLSDRRSRAQFCRKKNTPVF